MSKYFNEVFPCTVPVSGPWAMLCAANWGGPELVHVAERGMSVPRLNHSEPAPLITAQNNMHPHPCEKKKRKIYIHKSTLIFFSMIKQYQQGGYWLGGGRKKIKHKICSHFFILVEDIWNILWLKYYRMDKVTSSGRAEIRSI